MAVSHNWFFQWTSPPSSVFTNINSGFENVRNWNFENERTRDVNFHKDGFSVVLPKSVYDVRYKLRKKILKNNVKTETTRGMTLWLTTLGMLQTQSVPDDIKTFTDEDTPPFRTLYKWKEMDFDFVSVRHRQRALITGSYIPENVLPLGIEIWGSKVWITLPKWRPGVPATLATVARAGSLPSPPLKPYPDWTYHKFYNEYDEKHDCSGLTSVLRINTDQCGRLWVLDSGQINLQYEPKQICPPSIVVFDLSTDRMIDRYEIPKKYVLQNSLFSNIIVDTREEDCSDLHLYIADTWRFGLVVFRHLDRSFWKFSHYLFYPDPLSSNYTLHGVNFHWTDGILGLALTPVTKHRERLLFFHAMSSSMEYFVSTSVLKDYSRINESSNEFHLVGESRGAFGQSSASVIDRRGVMFYGLVTRDSIGCWNTFQPYLKTTSGVVAKNIETLIFPNDLKLDNEHNQNLWVVTNRLPFFQSGGLQNYDYNFRILYADTTEAVRQTVCDPNLVSYSYVPHKKMSPGFG